MLYELQADMPVVGYNAIFFVFVIFITKLFPLAQKHLNFFKSNTIILFETSNEIKCLKTDYEEFKNVFIILLQQNIYINKVWQKI